MSVDLERHLVRVQKLLALAGSTCNVHETALAVSKVVSYLEEHPLPMRWCVKKGTEIRLVPLTAMDDLREARAVIRRVALRKDNWFFEEHRVKDQKDTRLALANGFIFFQRHGYCIFVPVRDVEVFL
jgi:hypothetical protein